MGMKVCKKRWSDPIRTWWLPTTHLAIPFRIWCVTSYGIYWIKLTTILFLLMSGFGFWRLPHFLAITTNKIPPADDRIWLMYHIDRVPISHSIIDLINSLLEGKNYRQWLIVTACHSQSSVAQVSFCIWVGASFQSSPRVCNATFSGRILSVASLPHLPGWVAGSKHDDCPLATSLFELTPQSVLRLPLAVFSDIQFRSRYSHSSK